MENDGASLNLNKRLDALIEQFEPRIRNAFLVAVRSIKNRAVLSEMIRAIEAGEPLRALATLGMSNASLRPLTAMIERAFEVGGVTTVTTFPRIRDPLTGVKSIFHFDIRNSRAEAWLRDHSSGLVTRIIEDQRTGIQNILQDALKAGRNPRNTALDIIGRLDPRTGKRTGGIIGLTTQQERAVANAKLELASGEPDEMSKWFQRQRRDKRFDSIVQKAIRNGTPLSADQVARLTERYSDSLLQLRGTNIGRTETLASLNKSHDEAFRQVVETGAVRPGAVKRVWDSAGPDGRTRDSHLEMEGQTVGLDEPFTTPDGFKLMFPGDVTLGAPAEETINCRCRVKMSVDWLAGTNG